MIPHRSVRNTGPARLLGHLHRGPRADPPLQRPALTPETVDPEPVECPDPDAPCACCGARVMPGVQYCRRCRRSRP